MTRTKNPKEQFMFFTANCSIKFDNSDFPCECKPWFDYWYDVNFKAPEPDCQKCKFAIDVGAVPEPEEEDVEQET
jgi:hypothetical protein